MESVHPTKTALLQTVVSLIERVGPRAFTVEQVLEESGAAKGSLYHFFKDFEDLIEMAQLTRFAGFVDGDIAALANVLSNATTKVEFAKMVKQASAGVQSATRIERRLARAQIAGWEGSTPRFRDSLAAEQQRLTDAIADLAREAQSRGFLSAELDPRAVAVFTQAFSLGRVLDDVSAERLPEDAWNLIVERFIESVLLTD